MLRFTDNMLGNRDLEESVGFKEREEEFMRQFFLERVQEESVLSGPGVHVPALRRHDRQRLHPHDALPVPVAGPAAQPERRPLLLRELGPARQRARGQTPTTLYFKAENLAHRAAFEDGICKNCLSPCQVNVGAMKQFVPYAKFLVRAYKVKHNPERHAETLPATQ